MAEPFATIQLRQPVQFGKNAEPVTQVAPQATARGMRDFELEVTASGGFIFRPWPAARVGLRLAGIAGDEAFLALMDPRDVTALGMAVSSFFVSGLETGN